MTSEVCRIELCKKNAGINKTSKKKGDETQIQLLYSIENLRNMIEKSEVKKQDALLQSVMNHNKHQAR